MHTRQYYPRAGADLGGGNGRLCQDDARRDIHLALISRPPLQFIARVAIAFGLMIPAGLALGLEMGGLLLLALGAANFARGSRTHATRRVCAVAAAGGSLRRGSYVDGLF